LFLVFFYNNEELLEKYSYEQSLLTHGTLPAASISFAVNFVCSCFLNEMKLKEILKILPKKVLEVEKKWMMNKEYKFDKKNPYSVSDCLENAIEYLNNYQNGIEKIINEDNFDENILINGLRNAISNKSKDYLYEKKYSLQSKSRSCFFRWNTWYYDGIIT